MSLRVGDTIRFTPKNGGKFPTGESERTATIEAIRDSEIIIRQPDGFTRRITHDQALK